MSKATRNVAPIYPEEEPTQISIVIPAAGMGTRMKSYGPKTLINVSENLTIIQNQLNIINALFKDAEIILVVGFEADRVMNNTPDYLIKVENEFYDKTNVIRSIGLGLRAATREKVLIIYGDLVFNKETLRIPLDKSGIIIDSSDFMGNNEIGCTINGKNALEQMCYELPNKWSHIMFCMNKELKLLKNISWNRDKSMLFGFEAINCIINKGGKFQIYSPPNMAITDVDTSKDIKIASKILDL